METKVSTSGFNHITRLAGADRYATSLAVTKYFNLSGPTICVATGNNFPDALPASVLAHKLNVPILLIDSTVEGSSNALDYISEHLDKAGTIYIIGGSGVIGPDFKNHLKLMGYANINQIGGQDRYDTAYLLAQQLNSVQNTPVVISAGENYPDTLSISTFAAENSWPILLVQADSIDPDMLAYIQKQQLDKIYITGGVGVVSPKVEDTIKAVAQKAQIKRLAGSDRFATAREINTYFAPNPKIIYVASGLDYPDALAGSVLAAKSGSPIVLIDPAKITLPNDTLQFLMTLHQPDLRILGGTGVISAQLASNIYQLLNQGPLTVEPVTKGKYTISCSQSVNSALQFTGGFSLNIQWVGIRASREGNDYWSFVKPIDGQVDKGIYLQGPGTYSLAVCTSIDPQGPYGIMFYVDTIFGGDRKP